jgi:hypothetical protein
VSRRPRADDDIDDEGGKRMGSGDSISANITGDVSGAVAVGKHIDQRQTIGAAQLSADDVAQLRRAFADLRADVAAQAPPERQAAAAERIEELEQACLADEPDMTTIAYVGRWFKTNLPGLAGAVTGIFVHPVVGKVVGAAGKAIADELRGGA